MSSVPQFTRSLSGNKPDYVAAFEPWGIHEGHMLRALQSFPNDRTLAFTPEAYAESWQRHRAGYVTRGAGSLGLGVALGAAGFAAFANDQPAIGAVAALAGTGAFVRGLFQMSNRNDLELLADFVTERLPRIIYDSRVIDHYALSTAPSSFTLNGRAHRLGFRPAAVTVATRGLPIEQRGGWLTYETRGHTNADYVGSRGQLEAFFEPNPLPEVGTLVRASEILMRRAGRVASTSR